MYLTVNMTSRGSDLHTPRRHERAPEFRHATAAAASSYMYTPKKPPPQSSLPEMRCRTRGRDGGLTAYAQLRREVGVAANCARAREVELRLPPSARLFVHPRHHLLDAAFAAVIRLRL